MNSRSTVAFILLSAALGLPAIADDGLTLFFKNDNPNFNNNNVYVTFDVGGTGTVPFNATINGGPQAGPIALTAGDLYTNGQTGAGEIVYYDTTGINVSPSYT